MFYSLVALFIVGGVVAVSIALGVTVGTGGAVLRTGSLFVATIPRAADLFLNGARVTENPGILSGGTLIKNLSPNTYEVRAEAEGRIPWRASLPVTRGIVTRATDIFLWPVTASTTAITPRVDSFALSAGIPVIRSLDGTLSLDGTFMRGAAIAYASDDAATLITRTEGTVYLVGKDAESSTLNLSTLFHSLKERELDLPGIVPLIDIRPHPFSAGKFLIVTETSLYALDTRRISLERLATIEQVARVAWNDSEVLLLGADGSLTAVDLVFKTVATAPFASGAIARMESTAGGDKLVFLTAEGELTAYYRASGSRVVIADRVTEFSLSPGGARVAYAREGKISLYFLDHYTGDRLVPQATTFLLWEGGAPPHALAWNSSLPRYLFFLAGNELIAAELGFHGEQNHVTLAHRVKEFAFTGFTAYVLHESGELMALSFEE